MELENLTALPAYLYRFVIDLDENMMGASVIVRVTYRWDRKYSTVAEEQAWPVSAGPWESPAGPMDSDEVHFRGGADLFVFGKARHRGGVAHNWLPLTVTVGDRFRHELLVFGDRYWIERDGQLIASEPASFVEMPLTFAQAFGGVDSWDELEMPFPANPAGKGYAISAETARHKPLPNLESPSARISAWSDQPDPVGVAHAGQRFGPRLRDTVRFDERTGLVSEILPQYHNAAFPGMVVPRLESGERIAVDGVHANGEVQFIVPPCPCRLEFTKGSERHDVPFRVDQVGLEPDISRAFVTWRAPFRYRLVPEEPRRCVLEPPRTGAR